MSDNIKTILNLDKQRFVLLGGLQGSGKTTLSSDFVEAGYKLVSPDIERYQLAKKEHGDNKLEGELLDFLSNYDKESWLSSEEKVVKLLKEGKSVVFDATLTTPKTRNKVKSWAQKIKVDTIAVYIDATLDYAKKRNEQRGSEIQAIKNGEPIYGRYVPEFVLESKNRHQILPTKEEGFEAVFIISKALKKNSSFNFNKLLIDLLSDVRYTIKNLKESNELKNVFPHLDACWGISQDNKHHNKTLEEHMIKTAEVIINKFSNEVDEETLKLLVISALNHDIGKLDTKEFFGKIKDNYEKLEKDEKVIILEQNETGVIVQRQLFRGYYKILIPYDLIDIDENAHFYDHDKIGAVKIRRNLLELGANEDFTNEVYSLVLHHMKLPYKLESNKTMNKIIRKVGSNRIENLLRLRYADKLSSNTRDDFDDIHDTMAKQVQDLILKRR